MGSRARILIAALAVSAIAPVATQAQNDRTHGRAERGARSLLGLSNWTIEARGGLANFGRFLLESVTDPNDAPLGQRALNASNSFVYGGSVAATILPRTGLRLGFTRTSADLEYRDDSGTDSNALDQDDIADISSNVVSLEVIRRVLSDSARFTPYGGFGVAAAWWHLGDDAGDLVIAGGGNNTLFRLGANVVFGLQYRPARRWSVQLEANTMTTGNPFTGETSFLTTTGNVIDEPTLVRQSNYVLGIAYTFGQPRRRVQADR